MRSGAARLIAVIFGLLLALLVTPVRADETSGMMNLPKWWTATGGLEPIVKGRLVRIQWQNLRHVILFLPMRPCITSTLDHRR